MNTLKASIYSIDYSIKKSGKYRDIFNKNSWDVVLNTKGRKKVKMSLDGEKLKKFKELNLDIDDMIRITGDIDLRVSEKKVIIKDNYEIDILERAS